MESASACANPMSSKYSLQLRLVFAMLALLVISNVFFVAIVHMVGDKLEEELLEKQINNEVEEYIRRLAADGSTPFPQSANLLFYLDSNADVLPIPEAIKNLAPGIYHAIEWQDKVYQIAIRDMQNDRIYMALDISSFEAQENKLLAILIGSATITPLLAITFGLWLLRRIINPVGRLANEVARLNPRQRNKRLSSDFRGYEVERIAEAFDRYLENMDAFVEREQSFSAAASHELRTPVSVIATSAELMASEHNLPENLQAPLERIQRATQNMSALISSLLFLAREQPAETDFDEETELCELLEKIADSFRLLINTKLITFNVQCDQKLIVSAPADHISIVISNLLRNSVFHTKAGMISLQVRESKVVVSDTGNGIAPENMDKVFSREFKGRGSKGQGLGLYIAKRICEQHGWRLVLDSTPGQGTTATLDFGIKARPATPFLGQTSPQQN
jgi:signal transduction histidine kinase